MHDFIRPFIGVPTQNVENLNVAFKLVIEEKGIRTSKRCVFLAEFIRLIIIDTF